jgi:hypothetical protein
LLVDVHRTSERSSARRYGVLADLMTRFESATLVAVPSVP